MTATCLEDLQIKPFDKLKRLFLSSRFDASNESHVEALLTQLEREVPYDFRSAAFWFGLLQEASAAITDQQTVLEIAVQKDVSNHAAKEALERFDSLILSQLLAKRPKLIDIYLQSPWRTAMHGDDRGRIYRDFSERRKYVPEAMVALQLQENQLIRKYRQFIASAEVTFEGNTTPLTVVVGKLSDASAKIRQDAFRVYNEFVYQKEGQFQKIFEELLENRTEQARAANAKSYSQVAFAELGRIDYTAEDCQTFRHSILKTVAPAIRQLVAKYTPQKSYIEPWDAHAWSLEAPEKNPLDGNLKRIIDSTERVLEHIHPSFGMLFRKLNKHQCLDVFPKARKAPGAFSVTFPESGTPYIFGNLSGNLKDTLTLIHEFGHALHGYAAATIPNGLLRTPGMEFCEVASISMEFLASAHFGEFYTDPEDARKARSYMLSNALHFWTFMACMDEWQHFVYQNPHHSRTDRNDAWREISRRYRSIIRWDGFERYEPLGWLSRQHIFTAPFYFIDYGIAQLGACQLWAQSLASKEKSVENYIRGISLGAQRSLPELFEASGIRFDLSEKTMSEVVNIIYRELTADL